MYGPDGACFLGMEIMCFEAKQVPLMTEHQKWQADINGLQNECHQLLSDLSLYDAWKLM